MYNSVKRPGAIARFYHRTGHLPPNTMVAIQEDATFTQNIRALMNVTLEDDGQSPITDKTRIMPTVNKQVVAPVVISPPPFIEYRSVDNPLTMLFGAIVSYVQRFDHLPEILFVSSLLIPLLEYQTQAVTGKKFDGRFWLFSTEAIDGRLKGIPILTEEYLPDVLHLAIGGGSIGRDSVIAASER